MPDIRRVLVTGGAGHDVLCVDNFFTGDRANSARLLDQPRFEIRRRPSRSRPAWRTPSPVSTPRWDNRARAARAWPTDAIGGWA